MQKPNDQRSNVHNSNNQKPSHNNVDYKGKIDNRSVQLNAKSRSAKK
ncbi:MAG: hypothetical protein ACRC9L_04920 [Brevinema sp.]